VAYENTIDRQCTMAQIPAITTMIVVDFIFMSWLFSLTNIRINLYSPNIF